MLHTLRRIKKLSVQSQLLSTATAERANSAILRNCKITCSSQGSSHFVLVLVLSDLFGGAKITWYKKGNHIPQIVQSQQI